MINKLFQFLFSLSLILLVSSCAQVVPLSGGEKDTDAPLLISSSPKNKQLLFTGNKIELTFNEYIKLNSISQLIITPRLKVQPEINVIGKKLEINWKENLEPNTTYHFNFGNSIADITENNSINDFEFTFSTGEIIDTAFVKGTITDAFSLKPVTSALVGLYTSKTDSFAFFDKASYSAKSSNNGAFKIPFIKKGNYKLISIEDNNKNELYDIGEKIAFLNHVISLDTSEDVSLVAFLEETPKLFVKKTAQLQPEKFLIQLNKKVKNIDELILKRKNQVRLNDFKFYHSQNSDSIILYIKNTLLRDTLSVSLKGIQDSAILILQDKGELVKQFERKRYPFEIKPIQADKNNFPYFSKLILLSNFLLNETNENKIIVLADGKEIKLNEIKKSNDSLILSYNWQEETNYQFYFYPGAVKDYFGRTNDTLQFNFKTTSKDDYGSLLISIKKVEGNKIMQLMNTKNTCVFEKIITGSEKIKIEHLLPDQYYIRIIDDLNGDNSFTPGNLIKQVQPEKIGLYKDAIKILAGWENEIELPDEFINQ
jgi:hypothetical protein